MGKNQQRLTPLAIVTLGVLWEEPRHPYDVYRILKHRREDRTVKLSPGTLYHAIDRLAEAGLIEALGTERDGNRPERTTYRITDDGTAALRHTLATRLARPVNEYPEFPVVIGEAHALAREDALSALTQRRAALADEVQLLTETIDHIQGIELPRLWWLDVEYLHTMATAELAWLDGVLADLSEHRLDWSGRKPAGLTITDELTSTESAS